jgi:hypothetical protein
MEASIMMLEEIKNTPDFPAHLDKASVDVVMGGSELVLPCKYMTDSIKEYSQRTPDQEGRDVAVAALASIGKILPLYCSKAREAAASLGIPDHYCSQVNPQ